MGYRKLLASLTAALTLALSIYLTPVAMAATLHRGLGGEPDVIDPHKATLSVENTVLRDVLEGLVKVGPDGSTVPGMAKSWQTSADGLTWTFHLRKGLRWSDGSTLVAEDFVRGAQRLFAPETASSGYIFMLGIINSQQVSAGELPVEALGVEAPDPKTVVIRLSQPDPYFPIVIRDVILVPWHKDSNTGTGLIANGPYTLDDWVPLSALTLTRNPHYYDRDKVSIETIIYHPTPDLQAGVKRYRAGELDTLPAVPPGQLKPLKDLLGDEVVSGRVYQTSYLGFNLEAEPVNDVRVRRAIKLAVDREILANKVLRSGQTPSWRYTPDLIDDYAVTVSPFAETDKKTRQDEARRLLAEAGFGPDNPLAMEMRYIGEDQGRLTAVAIRGMLQQVGIELSLLSTDLKTHYTDLVLGKYQMATVGWNANPNPDAFLKAFEYAGGANTFNISKYNSPAFDALLGAARDEADIGRRNAAFAAAENLLLKDAILVPLAAGAGHALVKPKVKGYRVLPTQQTSSEYLSLAP